MSNLRNAFIGISILLITAVSRADEQLLFAIDIVRHGDRTPGIEIPKSPHDWKLPLGELTPLGIEQEHRLGQALRKEYIEKWALLPAKYLEGSLYVRSTDIARTKDSAKALLEGLYPLETRGSKVIPVETKPRIQDDLLLVKPSSNIFSIIKVYFEKRRFCRENSKKIQSKLHHWSAATGLELENMEQVIDLADNLFIRRLHNVSLPQGMEKQDADEIMSLAEKAMVAAFKLPEISEPTGKRLISACQGYFRQALEGQKPLKYVLYSGHDSTLLSILATLGVQFEETPKFASRLSLFLIKSNGALSVRVAFDGNPVVVPRCNGSICSLAQWNSL